MSYRFGRLFEVAVMEPTDLRNGDDPATWLGFGDPWWGLLWSSDRCSCGVVVGE
jgi:hypothetical protein